MAKTYQIIGTSSVQELAENVGRQLSLPVHIVESDRFPNREPKLRLQTSASTAILISSFSTPVNTHIIEFLLIADALKRQGCHNILGVITYLAYSKQDKVFLPGEPLSAKVIANILQTGPFTHLYTIDLHNPSISGYFDLPVTNISAVSILATAAQQDLQPHAVVVSPDVGSVKNSIRFAEKLGLPTVFATKTRNLETGTVSFINLNQSIDGQHVYIYDDMIATGSTLIQLSEFLKHKGAASVNVYCTHHLYLAGVQQQLDASPIDHITVTNTIAKPASINSHKLTIIDAASLIADQLAVEIHHD